MSATSFHTSVGGPGASGAAEASLPSVSVVIAAYDVADYLPEALASVLAQDGVDLEVVVVDDGSTDATGQIADDVASRDPRVVVVHQPNGGLGAARNTGIARASGDLLAFCDADDVVPPAAYAAMARSLQASGSDVAVGRIHRLLPDGTHQEPGWVTESHAGAPHRAVTADEHPVIIKDVIACNRLFRRTSWDERVGEFPVGVAYEDHVPILKGYLAGSRIDVLDEVTYLWRTRADESSISQRKAEETNLADRLAAMELAWHAVQPESPAVRSMWLARALELDLAGYYRHARGASDAYRARLGEAAARYLSLADDDALRHVSVHRKVSAWLAGQDRWDAVEWLEENVGTVRQHGSLVDGWPTADVSALDRFGVEVPARFLALSRYDTRARGTLREVRVTADVVEIDAEVWLRGVKRPTALDRVWLELGLPDRPVLEVETRHEGRRLTARIPIPTLRQWAAGTAEPARVTARFSWGDATGGVALSPGNGRLPLARPVRSAEVRLQLADDGALALRVLPPPAPTRALRLSAWGATALLAGPGARRVRVAFPDDPSQPLIPRMTVAGTRTTLAWPDRERSGVVVPRGLRSRRVPWRWEASVRGEAALVPRGPLLDLVAVRANDAALELTLQVRDPWGLEAGSVRWFAGTARSRRGTVTLTLTGDDLRPLTGPTRLTGTVAEPLAPVTVRAGRGLLAAGPVEVTVAGRDVRVRSNARDEVVLVVRRPGERPARARRTPA